MPQNGPRFHFLSGGTCFTQRLPEKISNPGLSVIKMDFCCYSFKSHDKMVRNLRRISFPPILKAAKFKKRRKKTAAVRRSLWYIYTGFTENIIK